MDKRVSKLRGQIARAKKDGGGRPRFGAELRSAAVELSDAWRASGRLHQELASALGISHHTLSTWRTWSKNASKSPVLRPVELTESRAAWSGISMTLPSGVQIEGLDVRSAAQLARELS